MKWGNKIQRIIQKSEFKSMIANYTVDQIECTEHTFFRLNKAQRKLVTCNALKQIIRNEQPSLVGVQYNQSYAAFYHHQTKILRMILAITKEKINIVTFYFIEEDQLPRL